jgi:flagellar hook protein FlgE
MSILSAMHAGVSGLSGQSEAISVYGDNIANANTTGFKTSRPEFQDVVAKSLAGSQIGSGVKLAGITSIFSQGSIQQTESPTDLSITGDGFFVLKGTDGNSFTRNGSFHFNKEGKLTNQDGLHVLGFPINESGKAGAKLSDISIEHSVIDAKKTSEVNMLMNLDLRNDANLVFDKEHPDQTSNFSSGVTVYDSAGTAHSCTLFFNKEKNGVWKWRAMAKGDEIIEGKKGEMAECASGKLTFDTDGRLKNQIIETSSFSFNKGALPNQFIKFSFGSDKDHGGTGLEVTQYGTNSEFYKVLQDGYTAGTLTGMTFADTGILTGIYSNGENINIAQVAISKFESPEGLFKVGQNRFRESRNSGQPNIGVAQTGGRGSVSVKTIESSTTDIASEFINLMQAQRNFQANSKVITTSDEMLQEVMNIKRN